MLQDWKFDDASPPAGLLSKGGLAGQARRIAMGAEDRMSVKRLRAPVGRSCDSTCGGFS